MENDDEERAEAIVERIEQLSRGTEGPMERLEEIVHPWVSFAILPIFALANAGIAFTSETLSDALASSVTLGIAAGLLFGKALGIFGLTWLAGKAGYRPAALGRRLAARTGRGVPGRHRVHGRDIRLGNSLR